MTSSSSFSIISSWTPEGESSVKIFPESKSEVNLRSKRSTTTRTNSNVRSTIRSRRSSSASLYSDTSSDIHVPPNVFYLYYPEVCRRHNVFVHQGLRPGYYENRRILNLQADSVKLDEWGPIITALESDTSLHVIIIRSCMSTHQKLDEEADTEVKVKQIKRWLSSVSTRFVLKRLVEGIEKTLQNSQVLSSLELEGLHLKEDYLKTILNGVKFSKSLKSLSFKSSPIGDEGCSLLCETLRTISNIESLDLSRCKLSVEGAKHVAKLIKYQRIIRYSDMWHSSLRSSTPSINEMSGIRVIILTNNPKISNEGLEFILKELDDDLWIKVLEMQRCNITEEVAPKILEFIKYNQCLRVFDFRNNPLTDATITKILEILQTKKVQPNEKEYHWSPSATSLEQKSETKIDGTNSKTDVRKTLAKTSPYAKNISKTLTKTPSRTITQNASKTTQNVQASKKALVLKPFQPVINETRTIALRKQVNEQKTRRADTPFLAKVSREYREKEGYVQKLLRKETAKRLQAEEKIATLEKNLQLVLEENRKHLQARQLLMLKEYLNKYIEVARRQENVHGELSATDLENILPDIDIINDTVEYLCTKQTDPNVDPPNQSAKCDDTKEKFTNMLVAVRDIDKKKRKSRRRRDRDLEENMYTILEEEISPDICTSDLIKVTTDCDLNFVKIE